MDKAWVKQESDQRHCLVQTLDKSEKIYCFLPPHAAPLQSSPFNRIMRSKPVPKHSNEQNLRRVGSWRFPQLHWTFWFVNVFFSIKNVEAHSKLLISFIIEVGRRNQIRANNYIVFWCIVCISYSCICICTGFVFCILSVYILFLNLKLAHQFCNWTGR